ncbi:MAG: response regulator, partial [Desulfobacteraceae bacterium]|nr:response regulator [Desulfobacteraceae bacterium]
LKLLRSTLPSDIEIKEDIAKDVGIISADPTQMHQVVMNLCINAGHAMQKEGGVLAVGLANVELDDIAAAQYLDIDAGTYLRLTVSDTGYGMTSDVKDRIFEPYFTTKEKGVGTGMGLSVVNGIVNSHGGTITIESEPGKGSTFHVYIPLIQEGVIKPEIDIDAPISIGNERILFIDDELALVDIGKEMLKHFGYEVTSRTSSIEALELFRTKPDRFDLVITDMTMPNMTGDKLAKELIKIRPDIPIIICTGFSERISEEKAKGMGIKAFAMKPLVMQDLAKTVRKVLDEN